MPRRKFNRAVDPRRFLTNASRNTTLPPGKALEVLQRLESRAVKIDARGKDSLPAPALTAMESRAISDAIRLVQIRIGMLKLKNKSA